MSRIFWDTMLFIYLLEGHPADHKRVLYLLNRANDRGDVLYSSYLALGELLAGPMRLAKFGKESEIQEVLKEFGFTFLPFDEGAVAPFSRLRAIEKLKIADSIHLACAASAGIDLFLTGDKQLMRLHVPGIQFIADFNTPLL